LISPVSSGTFVSRGYSRGVRWSREGTIRRAVMYGVYIGVSWCFFCWFLSEQLLESCK
jgi:hypothetical protein